MVNTSIHHSIKRRVEENSDKGWNSVTDLCTCHFHELWWPEATSWKFEPLTTRSPSAAGRNNHIHYRELVIRVIFNYFFYCWSTKDSNNNRWFKATSWSWTFVFILVLWLLYNFKQTPGKLYVSTVLWNHAKMLLPMRKLIKEMTMGSTFFYKNCAGVI